MISPAACCRARPVSRAVSAMDSLIGRDAGRAGLPAAVRDGRVAEGDLQVSVADVAVACRRSAVAGGPAAGRVMLPSSAPRMAAARSWARAARAVCRQIAVPGAGLGLVPAEHVLSRFERFLHRPAAPGDGDEVRHGRRAAGRRPAQVEGVAGPGGRSAGGSAGLPRAGGGGQRPVAVPGSFGAVPARPPLEHRVLHGLVCADHRAGGKVTWKSHGMIAT